MMPREEPSRIINGLCIRKITMATQSFAVYSDREVLGGTPVFSGTRVPLRNPIAYLEKGNSLDAFLNDFPS